MQKMIKNNDIKEKKEDFNEKYFKMNIHTVCAYTNKKQEKKSFLPAVKKHHFWLFGNIVRDIIQNFFFSRILILHEKKEEKKLCEIRYDEEKKIQHSVM